MFEDILRELKQLERGVKISVTLALDDEGYFERLCPWKECGFGFKVFFEDWKSKVPNHVAYCPFCHHQASPQEFYTPEQTKYLERVAQTELHRRISRGLHSSARRLNQRPQRGFITMRMNVSTPAPPLVVMPEAEQVMTIRIVCGVCKCRFAVVGAAYFCPACGHNSAEQTFSQSIIIARSSMASLPEIVSNLPDRDTAVQVSKTMVEGSFGSLVTAFQRFAEVAYFRLPNPAPKVRRNAFQNLTEGSQLWQAAGGSAYTSILEVSQMSDLMRMFQQRHLLAHQDGIVDQDYLDRSGDQIYEVGQRLVVRPSSVVQLGELLEILANGLRADLR